MRKSQNNACMLSFSVSEILFSTECTFELNLLPMSLGSDLSLVIDIYNLDNPVHPDGHLGWWKFSTNTLDTIVTCTFVVNKGVISVTMDGKDPSHKWVNNQNVFWDRLIVNAVLRSSITNAILYLEKVPAFKNKKDLLSFRESFHRDWNVPQYSNPGYVFPRGQTVVRLVSRDIFPRDAVGNLCLEIFRLLRQNKIPSEIYAENSDLSLNDIILRVDRLEADTSSNDFLFYFFSTYDPNLEMIRNLPFRRKIVYFHGVTKPELLRVFDPELSVTCAKAINQIPILQEFDLLASNSKASAAFLVSCFDENTNWKLNDVHVIPPRLLTKNLFQQKNLKSFNQETRLLYVGRIKAHKKIEDLLFFFSEYLEFDSTAKLWIVGSGENKAYWDYLKWIETRQLRIPFNKVNWIGSVSDSELIEYYASATAYISMSEDEGFCLPILEAMLSELPVFAYGVPAIREVLQDTGLYFLTKDYKYLAEVLHTHLSNPEKLEIIISKQRERASIIAKEMDGSRFLSLLEPE